MTKNAPVLDTENLTPAQKGAITRAANKAAREAEANTPVFDEVVNDFAFADENDNKVEDNVEVALDTITNVIEDPTVQATISKVTPGIPAKARAIIYNIGFYAGLVGAVAPIVAAAVTGDAQIAIATAGAVALSFNSWLAKANLSKTSDDLAKEAA